MASEFVRRVLVERRKRAVGTILGWAERRIHDKLTSTERAELREQVIAAVGAYHDVALDMLAASIDDGGMVNQEALRMLEDLHSRVIA